MIKGKACCTLLAANLKDVDSGGSSWTWNSSFRLFLHFNFLSPIFDVFRSLQVNRHSEVAFPFLVASIFGCLMIDRNAVRYITIKAKVGYTAGGKGIGTAGDEADGL